MRLEAKAIHERNPQVRMVGSLSGTAKLVLV